MSRIGLSNLEALGLIGLLLLAIFLTGFMAQLTTGDISESANGLTGFFAFFTESYVPHSVEWARAFISIPLLAASVIITVFFFFRKRL